MAKRDKENLTDTVAKAAQPGAVREFVWDEKLAGFGLRVEPSGSRAWVVKYRAQGGGRSAPVRWLTIGPFPVVKAKEARDSATKALAAVRLGQDPAGDLAAKRAEMTVAELVELYSRDGLTIQKGRRQGKPMKPTTAAYTKARLAHHVVPLLGKRRVTEITPGDVARFSNDVSAGKTAKDEKVGPRKRIIVRGGEGAARKVVRDLSAVFTFAIQHRFVSENPVATAKVQKTDNHRTRVLSLDEVKRLGIALDELEADGMNAKAANITRLWALSGCRRDEIAGLRWAEVDLAKGLLTLEDSKTGKSTRPLGAAALALLEALRLDAPKEATFVFPAERGDGFFQGTKRAWPSIVRRAGLATDDPDKKVTPHVLRHTLGGAAASGGEALLLVGAILGHSNSKSTQQYAHIDYDPARMAADRATAGIAAALGRAVKPAAQEAAAPDMNAVVAALQAGRELPPELAKALAAFASGESAEA